MRIALLAILLAGADPFVNDRLGRLSLTFDGLRRRDELVVKWCQANDIAVAIAMAGGYAPDVAQIVEIHATTVRTASLYSRVGQSANSSDHSDFSSIKSTTTPDSEPRFRVS